MQQSIISLKESLNRVEQADYLFRVALESYAAAVDSIDRHLLGLQPALEPEYRKRLKAIRSAITISSTPAAIEATRAQVDSVLAGYCGQTVSLLNERAEDIRLILLALAAATEALDRQSGGYGEQFRRIAQRMDSVKQLVDLGEIRREITVHAAELHSVAAKMQDEGGSAIARLEREMSAVRERLNEAEKLAETDPLTGLLNRRGMEKRIDDLIARKTPFSVMLLDLNRFKLINDRHGHLCGDEVLASVAARLAAEVRAGDPVCRWGGDEFLAALCLPYQEALTRAQHIVRKICGRYTLAACGGRKLDVSATVGLSEHRPGQTSKDVFAAADTLLYSGKDR